MLAAILAGLAVFLVAGAPSRVTALVLDPSAAVEAAATPRGRRPRVRWGGWTGGVVGVLAMPLVLGPRIGGWAVLTVVVGGTGTLLVRRSLRRRDAGVRRKQVALACQVVAGQLAAGQVPAHALTVAAEECPLLERAAATQRIGGEVGPVLRQAGALPGADGLVALAEAWELSERSGAPIARTAGAVAADLRDEQRVRAVSAAELAAPRMGGKVLAALPLAGMGVATVSGADLVHLFMHSLLGQYLLVTAAALACAGVLWIERISDGAHS